MARWRRAPVVRIYERGDTLSILSPDGRLQRSSGPSAELVREILAYLCAPHTADELVTHIGELAADARAARLAVQQALPALQAAGAIEPEPSSTKARSRASTRNVAVGLCGGIAAAHAPALAELLLHSGFTPRFAATESALEFVSAKALSAMTHAPVLSSWQTSDARAPVPHLALVEWAEAVVVYPATATTLSRIAAGDCTSVVASIAISARCPVLLVPAMNQSMLTSPAVQRNLNTLREDGFAIAHPAFGYEVAQVPGVRTPSYGAVPPLAAVVDLLSALLTA